MRDGTRLAILMCGSAIAGGVFHALWWRSDAGRIDSNPRPESIDARAAPDDARRLVDLTRRMNDLEARPRALTVDDSTHGKSLDAKLDQIVARIDALEATLRTAVARMGDERPGREPEVAETYEQLHDRWREVVMRTEKILLDSDPNAATSKEIIMWSRWDDLTKAKAALDRARDLPALKRLAEGEFKGYFTLKR